MLYGPAGVGTRFRCQGEIILLPLVALGPGYFSAKFVFFLKFHDLNSCLLSFSPALRVESVLSQYFNCINLKVCLQFSFTNRKSNCFASV